MFKNAREMALALASSENEFTDDDGNRYKCFADGDEYSHSPFRVFRNSTWVNTGPRKISSEKS